MEKTTEEIQYERLTTFYERVVKIAATVLSILITAVSVLTYKSVSDMRDDFGNTVKDLKDQVTQLKQQASEAVRKTKDESTAEILKIKDATKNIATEETQKELKNIFGTDLLQSLIRQQAVSQTNRVVDEVVGDKVMIMTITNDAAMQMRVGDYQGLKILKWISENGDTQGDKARAKYLFTQISNSYQKSAEKGYQYTAGYEAVEDKLSDSAKALRAKSIINSIGKIGLNYDAEYIRTLSRYTGQDFRAFEIDKINQWVRAQKGFPEINTENFLPKKP